MLKLKMGDCDAYFIKAISILIEDEIDPDTLLRIMMSAKHTTPILYSVVNVLKKAQFIDVDNKKLLYFISKHIVKISKYLHSNELYELINAIIKDEIEDVSIWIDIDNNLSALVLILYYLFPNEKEIQPLVHKLNHILDRDNNQTIFIGGIVHV